jgi:DNA modification methylase
MSPEIRLMPLRKLRRNPRNARTHSKKQIEQIAESLRRFGFTSPIVTDESGIIIAGHGRVAAAELIGLREVPVLVKSGLKDTEKRALMLADNRIAASAGWDRELLAVELGELIELLPECNLTAEITGFSAAEIDSLLEDFSAEGDPADNILPPRQQSISRRGDLWQLGQQRIVCGDAKSDADMRLLMAGDRAQMVFTDPPYNVRVSSIVGRGLTKHREFLEGSGELSPEQFTAFLKDALGLAAAYSVDGSIHFVFMDWRHVGELLAAGREVYSELKNLIVWVESNAAQGSFYRSQHELIFVFKHGSGPHLNHFELGQHGRLRSNVWSYAGVNSFRAGRMEDLKSHPTAKPVAMVVDAIKDCSRRGDIVLDPFAGSGTALVAAEKTGRRGRGLEIDPVYVDVAIRRWQNFTRRDAMLAATGQTFDEITEARCRPDTGA